MILYPNCKINLGLNVTARRPDGYHDLETAFYPTLLTDTLEILPLNDSNRPYELHLTGNALDGPSDDNLVLRIYRALRDEFHLPPVEIFLHKRIPSGAGLGGGSSDAAYTLRALNDLFLLQLSDEEMERRLAPLGADCPFFVKNTPVYATGIGTSFSPLPPLSLKGLTLVLVKPDVFVSTKEAYAGVVPSQPATPLSELLKHPVEEWERIGVKNDFEKSVFAAHPSLAAIKETLYQLGALYAAMSGSGSTIFGIFPHKLEHVEEVFKNCFVHQETMRA